MKELNIKMPELTGSEKQIKWAESLRMDWYKFAYEKALKLQQEAEEYGEELDLTDREFIDVIPYIIENVTKASEWIDARYNLGGATSFFVICCVAKMKKEKKNS